MGDQFVGEYSDPLASLAALGAEEKRRMRRLVRKRLSECHKLLARPLPPERRAYLSGYLGEAERALRMVS